MKMKNITDMPGVEGPENILRRTLAYNDEAMLCHFTLKKDAKIPLHDHRASQIGIIFSGRVRFIAENKEDEFEVGPGDTYCFSQFVKHGTEVLEDTIYVEVFSPARDEYKDF